MSNHAIKTLSNWQLESENTYITMRFMNRSIPFIIINPTKSYERSNNAQSINIKLLLHIVLMLEIMSTQIGRDYLLK